MPHIAKLTKWYYWLYNCITLLCMGYQSITQILSIIDAQHPPWVNGMELLDDALHRKHVLPTGCEGYVLLTQ